MLRSGSAGVVVFAAVGYGPYLPHVGTSTTVFDDRAQPATEHAASVSRSDLVLSVADQAREVLAALSLNKTQLAVVLGVSRPTLYDWLEGRDPNASNAQRLTTLLRLLSRGGVTSADPLIPRFLRQSLSDGTPSLFDVLSARVIDEVRFLELVREAKSLGEQAENRRLRREEQLRSIGFDDPSDGERRDQLARNIAMRDWPKS
ncbi:MAG: helix-turn-helix domain-containing protein [Deltaproteobacteria bacterium]|nr:helix-turn-helix domain-containing protein [Deltaproteobacteria bacterium]